jgi:hypothetical protein
MGTLVQLASARRRSMIARVMNLTATVNIPSAILATIWISEMFDSLYSTFVFDESTRLLI